MGPYQIARSSGSLLVVPSGSFAELLWRGSLFCCFCPELCFYQAACSLAIHIPSSVLTAGSYKSIFGASSALHFAPCLPLLPGLILMKEISCLGFFMQCYLAELQWSYTSWPECGLAPLLCWAGHNVAEMELFVFMQCLLPP